MGNQPASPVIAVRDPVESYGVIFLRFLRLGALGFGGPPSQLAQLQEEFVQQRKWCAHSRFNRALAVYQLLPGPEALEMCCWMGGVRRGRMGALLAGLGFVLPGTVLVLLAAWWFLSMRTTSGLAPGGWISSAMMGMQAAALAMLWHGVSMLIKRQWEQARSAERPSGLGATQLLRRGGLLILLISAAVATVCGVHFAIVLVASVLAGVAIGKGKSWLGYALMGGVMLFGIMMALATNLSVKPDAPLAIELSEAYGKASVAESAWVGLKAGMLSFGGAYTAVPILEQSVTSAGWMRSDQVLQGLAVVNCLPAPLVSLAGYTGMHSAAMSPSGPWWAAMAMLLGVYLPAFAFTLIGHELIEEATDSEAMHGVLESAGASVIGVMLGAAMLLVRPALGLEHGLAGSVHGGPAGWVLSGVFLIVGGVMAWAPTRYLWLVRAGSVVVAAGVAAVLTRGNA